MGSVKQLMTTGDNDVDIYPRKYYRYYMYCDRCNSFDIKQWIEPENHQLFEAKVRRYTKLSNISFWASMFFLLITLIWFLVFYFMTGGLEVQILTVFISGIFFVGFLVFNHLADKSYEKIKILGVKCMQCSEKYKNGSIFFEALDRNLNNYTMEDVPKPLGNNYWIKGDTID